mmetsp:Transcript_20651/g.48181  ORF Transcript_20651/g.48181 Transcript_20651/m.48181 type:complete len:315 (-) Transcript_20651:654-1598(-)
MGRLVMLVVHPASSEVLQQIKRYHAIWLRILNLFALNCWFRILTVFLGPTESPRLLAAAQHQGHGAVPQARPHPSMPSGLEISHTRKLVPNPGGTNVRLVLCHLLSALLSASAQHGFRCRCSGKHSCLHCCMAALDLCHIEESSTATCQHPAGEGELWHGLQAALIETPRAIREARATLQQSLHSRMLLEALELLVRTHVWIGVIKANHHAYMEEIRLHVIDERSTVAPHVQGPADRVSHGAGRMVLGLDLPDLFDTQAVVLRGHTFPEVVMLHEQLTQGASATFCKDGLLAEQMHAWFKRVFLLAILRYAHIT